MNSRERWLACMRFEPVDHIPDVEFGYWEEVYIVWHQQGLPKYVNSIPRADAFFGFETVIGVPTNPGLNPGFEYTVISEDSRTRTIIDWDGATKMIYVDGSSTIPRYLKYPIETRDDWNEFKKRIDFDDPTRYFTDEEWKGCKETRANSQKVVTIHGGSLFGRIRDRMGFENIAIACMDDPMWVEEMIEYQTELHYRLIKHALDHGVKIDRADFWEDMAFNHGPIISPVLFRKWLTPRYKRITDLLHKHGCMFSKVDCDGNINCVVDGWLDGGVNIMFPLEIRGGTDPYWMREKFGRSVLLEGGVDKTQLIAGKDSIDREIERITPLVQQGGYVPHVDHRCPPDVTYENYLYYLKRKREAFGIPEPAPWEERKYQYKWAEE